MTDFAGSVEYGTLHADNGYVSGNIKADRVQWRYGLTGVASAPWSEGVGALAKHQPVTELGRNYAGADFPTFFDDWYNRIHIVPGAINLGNLLSSQTRRVEVWNGYFVTRSLTDLTVASPDGSQLVGITAPADFGPLLSEIGTLSISSDGPPTIDAVYSFVFDIGTLTLEVTGRRVVVFSIRPNWAQQLIEGFDWLTDILPAYDGLEQRRQILVDPHRRVEYSVLVRDRDVRVMENLLYGWQTRLYGLPLWFSPQLLAADLPPGSTSVELDTTLHEIYAGSQLVFFASALVYETIEVDAVDGNAVTFAKPTERDWPQFTRVMPLVLTRLELSQDITRPTSTVASAALKFTVEDPVAIAGVDSELTYLGAPVFLTPPEATKDSVQTYLRKAQMINFNTGAREVDDESGFPSISRPHAWKIKGRDKVVALKQWLFARSGRFTSFWVPSWNMDAVLTRLVASGDQNLYVQNTGYAQFIAADQAERDLFILLTDGTVFLRRIVGAAAVDDDEELISLDASLGRAVTPAQISLISYLHLARLGADTVELAYTTDDLVNVETPFVTVTTLELTE